ncbi:hypothetical protein N802_03435 [Knoellia sinensis KCTC 19936]|uniref:Uncharacterized protein n=1 Tax=Knoellia sinensis KCTC 19936 TaxID=1385520 RepID=A0A0A0J3J2_9MICO|nr:hypothetical protein [Knoellia sinensis]KGN31743.1 hypothetical protein N802_03435 [Knoellia sinensis KCTC 19936]
MTFKVKPASVTKFGDALHDLRLDADQAKTYAAKTKPPASGFSAMVRFLNSCQEVKPAVEDFFGHLSKVSQASAKELRAAGKTYTALDQDARARLDAKYPKG